MKLQKTYDRPLALAVDSRPLNVTQENIRVRVAVIDEDICLPPAASGPKLPPDAS